MAELVYLAISSLDGYIEDESGRFDWAVPGDEAHAFINDFMRPFGIYLYGRRMYETMRNWETEPALAEHSPISKDFAEIWQGADKVVFSRSLEAVSTNRTRIERDFDPESVRRMKEEAGTDLAIGGPELAAEAFRAGLVDECHLFLAPISVGSGKQSLPGGIHLRFELLGQRRFADGMVYLRYRVIG